MLVDLFYFNDASNVQKAGEILTAKYPHDYYLQRGEHVVSLFFSDVAKLAPVKVRPNGMNFFLFFVIK